MIEFILIYGLGVIMGTAVHTTSCPKTVQKQCNNRAITVHKQCKIVHKRVKPLITRRPFLPWEIRRNR